MCAPPPRWAACFYFKTHLALAQRNVAKRNHLHMCWRRSRVSARAARTNNVLHMRHTLGGEQARKRADNRELHVECSRRKKSSSSARTPARMFRTRRERESASSTCEHNKLANGKTMTIVPLLANQPPNHKFSIAFAHLMRALAHEMLVIYFQCTGCLRPGRLRLRRRTSCSRK